MIMFFLRQAMSVRMSVMMVAAAQQPCARDIHSQTQAGNRDGLGKVDRYRVQDARDRLITNQKSDHRQNDGAGESRQITELACPEREAWIVGVFTGAGVGEGSEQQGSRMRAHMHAIRYKSN